MSTRVDKCCLLGGVLMTEKKPERKNRTLRTDRHEVAVIMPTSSCARRRSQACSGAKIGGKIQHS
jgi:hypothetical protein